MKLSDLPLEVLEGAGGGKDAGSARTPVEAPDNLRSKAFAKIIDLVSEGEIVGLTNGLKSIYLDGVALQNADNSYNFQNVSIGTTVGVSSQAPLPGFSDVEQEINVAVEIKAAVPATRTIINSGVNAARVLMSFPGLQTVNNTNGDITGATVTMAIEVQSNGGGFVQKWQGTISGKTTSSYQRSVTIQLAGGGPYDIRVKRITQDTNTNTITDKSYWASYTEITEGNLSYPNSAMVGLMIDAQQFSRIPVRGYDLMGRIIQVPNNYDPITRVYTGTWSGTFKLAWTDNPAWVVYDLATNPRYGLGRFANIVPDKWSLYSIAQYCDALVADGFGGQEPRFTCSLYLQQPEESLKVLRDLCSIFRGMAIWAGAQLSFMQDAPQDISAIYTQANIVGGIPRYEGASASSQHTVAIVAWNDPGDLYRQRHEYVDADDLEKGLMAKYGYNPTQIIALGATSRGQARRIGRWLIYSEIYEQEIVNFEVGLEGIKSLPGQTFQLHDTNRAGARMGGRISNASATQIVLDKAVTLDPGTTYTLTCIVPGPPRPQTRQIITGAGTTATLNVFPAFDAVPIAQSVWILASANLQPTTWRCINVKPVDGKKNVYSITGLSYHPSKYGLIESNLKLEKAKVTRLSAQALTPTGLILSESLYIDKQGRVKSRLTISWKAGELGELYQVSYRRLDTQWNVMPFTSSVSVDIDDVDTVLYSIEVRAMNSLGRVSLPVTGSITIVGKLAPPSNVSSLSYGLEEFGVRLSWPDIPDLDRQDYILRVGASFDGGAPLEGSTETIVSGTNYLWRVKSAGTRKVWIKARDDGNRVSLQATSVDVVIAASAAPNNISASFSGPNYVLSWPTVYSAFKTSRYRVRRGLVFATAALINEPLINRFEAKCDWLDTERFWISVVDVAENEGAAVSVDLAAPAPGVVTGLDAKVSDNNINFYWTKPASVLPIALFDIKKGATFATAVSIGTKPGDHSFMTYGGELVAATNLYWFRAQNSAGQWGSVTSIQVTNGPVPDFVLRSEINTDFSTGTKINTILSAAKLTTPRASRTWHSRFSPNGWTNVAQKIAAGFTLYAQPTALTGSYEETVDYGTALGITTINVDLQLTQIVGTVTPSVQIAYKTLAGDPWTLAPVGSTVLATNFRYVRYTISFAGSDNKALARVERLLFRLSLKNRRDNGSVNALATDTNGTRVFFNTAFASVTSRQFSPNDLNAVAVTSTLQAGANPTYMDVKVYDKNGSRLSCAVDWTVEGQ
jgi:hypothetical protein